MLPKIKSPVYDVTIPSSKKVVKVRPFEVKEERILLMARQSGEPADFFAAMEQIVGNCVLDEKVSIPKMPLFDVEFLFTKIRAVSVSNIAKVQYKDQEDGQVYDFEVDLEKIEVKFPEDISTTFKVNSTLSFSLKYPPMSLYTNKDFFDLDEDGVFEKLITTTMDKVFDGEEVHDAIDSKPDEILEFINSLPARLYGDLRKFFMNQPTLFNELKYTNKNGKEVTIVQRTIEDFFTFG